ncbi:hypothetical protein ASC80_01775 [Afipia sp. Root123D2]|uniref:hypothetical protein n=1 Tax=Afipia sp. Root123D2 TaxID=1736436 RepID=UPI0006FD5CCD|nr:hypothetical protein [Afipia sp. Root123D2]KQW22152.1 hypothetical protein ASC80_01775 [Afipia sp. Root123D2]
MTARKCFVRKISAGKVSSRSGRQILDMMNAFEEEYQRTLGDAAGGRQAALDAAEIAKSEAARKADQTRGSIIAQSNVLRSIAAYDGTVVQLRETPGDLGFGNKAPPTLGKDQSTLGFAVRSLLARDPFEISSWNNVHYLARNIRGVAHAAFADTIEFLRPKKLGFQAEATRELDVLRAVYGQGTTQPEAGLAAQAWAKVAKSLGDQYRAAGGVLAERENWRLPNPAIDAAKVRALGADRFRQLVRDHADRADMLDWDTGAPLNDARFNQLLDSVTSDIIDGPQGPVTAARSGRPMLANQRDMARFFSWKSAESWQAIADAVGTHQSVFETMTNHIKGMADDIAALRVLGPNPEATKTFIHNLFDREAARLAVTAGANATPADLAAAVKTNRGIESRIKLEKRLFDDLYAEVTGSNQVAVNTTFATGMANARHWLSATQLGSAIISSFTDPGSLAMVARFNGLPVMNTLQRATAMMTEKGSEIFVAQQGLVLDSLAHAAGQVDRIMGEEIRTGLAQKLSSANIRASGLRKWTAMLRGAFGLEMMAHVARERGKAFAALSDEFRGALSRYGIAEGDWDLIRATAPHEPQPNAVLVRPIDIAEGATPAHRAAADKFQRMIDTEMDYAVIEGDPVTRALMIGDSKPGSLGGETRRAVSMYRSFPATFVMMHFSRAAARGWDGSRLAHSALAFSVMTALGVLSMQTKEVASGRDPLSLDPTTGNGLRAWGKAVLQGGGFGVFGDILFLDQTRYGNSWAATLAGPLASSAESILGDFVIKNIQQAGKGQETHFAGDALYALGRHIPGSSLWFSRLAFQRGVLDQLALMADPRARERFARIEGQAKKEWGQDYWLPPGRTETRRAPNFGAIVGN